MSFLHHSLDQPGAWLLDTLRLIGILLGMDGVLKTHCRMLYTLPALIQDCRFYMVFYSG
jgi:hypothetical protein